MYVAGLWKRKDIDSIEANLYRKILFLNKGISNKAILNTMTSIRLAGEAINNLASRTREESERQKRITSYFEKEEEIGGIRCTKMVKYLGVKINADVKLQRKTAKEQIYRNLNTLKWRLREAEPDVV